MGSDRSTLASRLARYGKVGSKAEESFAYQSHIRGLDIVLWWIIDDISETNDNRFRILNPEFNVVGIASGKHK